VKILSFIPFKEYVNLRFHINGGVACMPNEGGKPKFDNITRGKRGDS
jgi:hypothetical protein